MSDVKWIKLSTGLFDDEKIRYIEQLPDADSILTIWVKLLVLAGKKNLGGEIIFNDELPYTDEMLATIFHRKVNTVRLALEAFQKLRMIEISSDRTIIICNWAKYQNLEGLEKIRQQNLERVRRHRLRQSSEGCNVSRNVTDRYIVTPALRYVTPPEIENKKEKREIPPPVPHRGTKADVLNALDYSEAKQWLSDLFGRQRAWSDEEEVLLRKIVPVSRTDQKLIQWGYSLYRDDEGWAMEGNTRLSKPKHNLITLLREFGSETDKWRGARKQVGLSSTFEDPPVKKEPPQWREFFFWKYDTTVRLPESFWELDDDQREEYERDFQTFVMATQKEVPAA